MAVIKIFYVLETRREDGKTFPSSTITLTSTLCEGADSANLNEAHPEFKLRSAGIGAEVNHASIITCEEEEMHAMVKQHSGIVLS